MREQHSAVRTKSTKQVVLTTEQIVPISDIVESIGLFYDEVLPEVNCYLMGTKKAGHYRIQISIMTSTETFEKKRNRFSRTLPDIITTDKQATKACNDIKLQIQSALAIKFNTVDKHLFYNVIDEFLEFKRKTIEMNSVDGYEYRFVAIKRFFPSTLYIESIDVKYVNDFVTWCLTEGKIKTSSSEPSEHKGFSRRTIKDLKTTLHTLMEFAVQKQYIETNPCPKVKIPKTKKDNTKPDLPMFLTLEEYNIVDEWFYNVDYNCTYKKLLCMFELAVVYGLRLEELIALKWDAIIDNWDHFVIKRTIVRGKQVYFKDNVKSESSYRTYHISNETRELINTINCDSPFGDDKDGYWFAWSEDDKNRQEDTHIGSPYRPDYIQKQWNKAMRQCEKDTGLDLAGLSFHKLRHTCASVLFDQGWNLEHVQQWLGHESSEITKQIYIHKMEDWKDKKKDSMDEIWFNYNK